jgi:hypothetical protein
LHADDFSVVPVIFMVCSPLALPLRKFKINLPDPTRNMEFVRPLRNASLLVSFAMPVCLANCLSDLSLTRPGRYELLVLQAIGDAQTTWERGLTDQAHAESFYPIVAFVSHRVKASVFPSEPQFWSGIVA